MHEAAGAEEAITINRFAHLVGGCRMAGDETAGVVDRPPDLRRTEPLSSPTAACCRPRAAPTRPSRSWPSRPAPRSSSLLHEVGSGDGHASGRGRDGASAGVGRATAVAFAAQGFDVAVLARGAAGLAAAVDDIAGTWRTSARRCRRRCLFEEVDAAAEQVERDLGPIDVWVNDAMTTVFAPRATSGPRTSAGPSR